MDCFQAAAQELESLTNLSQIEARGTVRIALKRDNRDAQTASVRDMYESLRDHLPDELYARGIENATEVCEAVLKSLQTSTPH